jgi:hypothetical protein
MREDLLRLEEELVGLDPFGRIGKGNVVVELSG